MSRNEIDAGAERKVKAGGVINGAYCAIHTKYMWIDPFVPQSEGNAVLYKGAVSVDSQPYP